jgi:electron-transferring-flavoprotein dehydrogenase
MAVRETLDVDILIVGGGPAGLSAALRLSQLQQRHGGPALSIALLEKAREAGAHSLSGAVLDLSALRELLPDYVDRGAPLAAPVAEERVLFLTRGSSYRLPVIPPPLRNHGNAIISLNAFVRWLAGQVEAAGGVDLFTGFAGQEVLMEGERVLGVRTGDRGISRHGTPKSGYEAGVDLLAKVTIFCDGVRGNLTKQLLRRLQLGQGRAPEQFAVGLKELWDLPAGRLAPGTVIHTLGYPLRREEFGGGFLYGMPENRVSLGLVTGLDYRDPLFDPHMAFNRLKQHPLIAELLAGGTLVRYGAKALPEGGWRTIPRLSMEGGLIAGDAGGFVNSLRLKGIHLAMRTGMLAAETAIAAVRDNDVSRGRLASYEAAIARGPVRAELYPVRNVHQAFGHGLLAGVAASGLAIVSAGRLLPEIEAHPGHDRMMKLAEYYPDDAGSSSAASTEAGGPSGVDGSGSPSGPSAGGAPVPAPSNATTTDRRLTFDKLTNVHFAGTAHEEDQPSHLLVHTDVCQTICGPEYGHPCTRFCPAQVYEIVRDADGRPQLQINASNCVHCKTCDIMDPYAVITWVPPEGGGGPTYTGM